MRTVEMGMNQDQEILLAVGIKNQLQLQFPLQILLMQNHLVILIVNIGI